MKHERPLKVLTVAALVLGAVAVALGGFLLHKGAAVHAIAAIVLGGVEMLLCVLELLCIKKLEGEIVESREYALRTDGMTGIRNRFGYYHDGRKLLLRNIETPYSVVDLDVDHFTNLNILYGYDKGDAMLKSLAACMESACGEGECCGRIEGDHFALLIRRTTRQEDTARIEKMIAVARSTASYPLRLCVGVYEIENNIEAIEYVTDCAVAARLKVKRDNGAGIAFYDYAIHQQEITSNELVDRMEDALRDGEFCAYYQPIYDLQRNCVCAAEALVRWIDHDGRFMPPDKFIHLFERNGLIMQLDFYVLEEVCRMQSEVLKLGLDPVPIAVNFSRAHLYEKDLIPRIAALLDKYCIAHWMVDIELTESMLNTDQELMLQTASALSAAGYSVSMDDFGSGASSLNLLKNIQLDKVKLDREFLVQCDTDARGRTVVRSVLKMAQQLKLKTVAEGVETEEQLEFLREAGCDMVQGYLLARPMPADRFRDVIEDAQKKSYHIKAPRAVRRAGTEE